MGTRSPVNKPRNMDQDHFTSLEMTEPPTSTTQTTPQHSSATSPHHGTTSSGTTRTSTSGTARITPTHSGKTVGGLGHGMASRSLTTTVKTMTPYVSMKTALVVIALAVVLVVAIGVTVTVIIVERQSGSDARITSPNKTDTTTTAATTSTTALSTSSSSSTASSSTASSSSSQRPSTEPSLPSSTSLSTLSSTSSSTSSSSSSSTTSAPITTVSSTETTIPISNCSGSEFTCATWHCIPYWQVCDGRPDCPDGSDEGVPCACTDDQFRCANGQCVPKLAICDERYDCLDKSDETNCPDCAGFRCVTNQLCLWDRMAARCNYVLDCDDLSDEINCSPRSGYKYCSNGVQVSSAYFCDGLDDCGDNSDEENCACKRLQEFSCVEGGEECIPATWRCDGHLDCSTGSDELGCDKCSQDQLMCKDYTCVNESLRCDGKVDCPGPGGDEDDCVELSTSGELQVVVEGWPWPVCADGWQDRHSSWVCSTLHTSPVMWWTSQPLYPQPTSFAYLKYPSEETSVTSFELRDSCQSDVVHMSCHSAGCGQRKVEVLESFIAGGGITPLGKWPWVVSLSYLNKPICGGVLLDKTWVLTAAHCVFYPAPGQQNFTNAPFYFTITAGTTSIWNTTTTTTDTISAENEDKEKHWPVQDVRVSKIIIHPETRVMVNGGVDWDLALLQLDKPVTFTSVVQPICLPEQGRVFPPTSHCFVAGWGILSYRQHIKPNRLRDTRMQLWSESRCRDDTVIGENYVNTNSTLCAGYLFGRPTGCQGDSGGPLMCFDSSSQTYLLAGIVSRGSERCGKIHPYTRGNRYSNVAMASDWVQKTMNDHL